MIHGPLYCGFIFKNTPSNVPRGEKTNGSFEDLNDGEQGRYKCGPMDARRVMMVGDLEERRCDRDRSREYDPEVENRGHAYAAGLRSTFEEKENYERE